MCGSARKALECIMWTCNQPIERATASFKRRWYLNFFRKPLRFWLEISEKRSRENTRWKENRNVIIDRRTDVQDRSSTNYIIIYGNPNILFTTISKCRDVEKVEHIQWQWIVWSTCLHVFIPFSWQFSMKTLQTMQNARFTCFKHLFSIQCVTSHLQCMLFTDMKLSIHLVSLFCFEKLNAFASWRLQQSHGSSVILMLFVVLQRRIDHFNVMAQHRLISMQSSFRLKSMYLWHHR